MNLPTRTFDILAYHKEKYNNDDILAKKVNGEWKTYSTDEYIRIVNDLSSGFLALGIQPNDKVAIIASNCPEWNFVDMALAQIQAISVPMYPTISKEDYAYIFNDAQVKVVFAGDKSILSKVLEAKESVPCVDKVYSFFESNLVPFWEEVSQLGQQNPNPAKIKELSDAIKETDLLTLIYTSGTTGKPKGVMLSHKNVMSNAINATQVLPVPSKVRALSFLPLCHVFERTNLYIYQYSGASTYYAESLEAIGSNLKEVKPYMFSTVPRLLEKVFDKIMNTGEALTGIKRSLFFWAVDLGLKYEHNHTNGWWYDFKLAIANKLIFSKWREALGGNVNIIASGAAALQPRLARIFTAAQINVLEGYGLTETSPVITVNSYEVSGRKFGTVGVPIPGVEVKIAEDGEILCKGDNVMMGYYNQPEQTAEVLKDGWFHTGDIGVLEDGKYLKITDRKKEMFKTSGGKYVAPQPMENKFKESPFIEQLMIVGDGEKYPAALIVPSYLYLQEWAKQNEISYTTKEELLQHTKVIETIHAEVRKYNAGFGNWEQVKKFELLPNEWTDATGELTPTQKLKRKVIAEKYKEEIKKLFA